MPAHLRPRDWGMDYGSIDGVVYFPDSDRNEELLISSNQGSEVADVRVIR